MGREELLEQILNETSVMIQISEVDTFEMVYANEPARLFAGHVNLSFEGEKCYKYMSGLDEQCPFCPLRKMNGAEVLETEVYNGSQFFAVKTKITEMNGKKVFIEYFADITTLRNTEASLATETELNRKLENSYEEQEAQLEEIRALNAQLQDNQAMLEELAAEQEAQIEEISALNKDLSDREYELARHYAVIESIAHRYSSIHCIDLTVMRTQVVKCHPDLEDIIGEDSDIFEVMDSAIRKLTIDEEYEKVRDFGDVTKWAERLRNRDAMTMEFRNSHLGWSRANIIAGYRNEEGECTHVIFTVEMIEDEVEARNAIAFAKDAAEARLAEINELNKKLKAALDNYKEADYDRRRDFLTGLRNRQDMFELLEDVLSGKRENIRSMFMMDIDNFKFLNDHFGHIYGDVCLQKIGAALNDYGKENDIVFYRYGGEEILGVCFNDCKDPARIADEIVKLIYNLNIERNDLSTGRVTVSLGYTTDNRRYEKMVDLADKAMYRAKDRGKNQFICYEDM